MVDDFKMRLEAGFWRLFGIRFQVIDAANVAKEIERELCVPKEFAHFNQIGRLDNDKRIVTGVGLRRDLRGEFVLESRDDVGGVHWIPRLRFAPADICRRARNENS
jgi:hypothetical protein